TNWVDLQLTQDSSSVNGSYAFKGGKLTGTINGKRLDYSWIQTDGKTGKGYFVISDDGKAIDGRYGYGGDNSDGGEWKGTKAEKSK
ncbi:MAG: hypothetical protein GY868_13680, partial [Deltaproteobacteria bacterium]|nr:hypothetical protein [Deltaproteobacteria bacterium]